MIFKEVGLDSAYLIELNTLGDSRGWFARTYCKNEFMKIHHQNEWVQFNHSFTQKKGSIRGMHFQIKPYKEIKLIRCISGAVFDVIVDLRKESTTFLQWKGVVLSAENKLSIYIPEGFAHGFQTLSDNTELIYQHSEFYKPDYEAGILYNDPLINISWPETITNISERDKNHPLLDNHFKGI
jgi:dTDP-4-dehydrorhamnose 3,5-epimerase